MEATNSAPTAIVVARDEETRILLRGLLRLRHFRIVGEAEGSTNGGALVRQHRPQVLVLDASLAEGSASSLIRETRETAPATRVVLVSPSSRGAGVAPMLPAPDATLTRPFRIHEFEHAIAPAEPPGPAAT